MSLVQVIFAPAKLTILVSDFLTRHSIASAEEDTSCTSQRVISKHRKL